MKRTLSEKKVLKKLGIPDFRHMTKDKIVKLASMLPYMDPEVAKAAIHQFPEFKDMACNLVCQLKESIDKGMDNNNKSQDEFYLTCNDIISSLQKELEKENISEEERDRIENKMIMIAQMKSEKDTENKIFIQRMTFGVAGLAAIFGFLAHSSLGGKSQTKISNFNREQDNTDENDDNDDNDNNDIIDV